MSNPVAKLGIDFINALQALKLKRHELIGVPEGVEIHQPGKPVLLLTYEAAKDFAAEIEEARNG